VTSAVPKVIVMTCEHAAAISTFEIAQLVIQIVGLTAIVLTLLVYYRQLLTMQAQRKALEQEIAARMRPWIGLFDFGMYAPDVPSTDQALKILLRNSGQLPAQNARLSLVVGPADARNGESDESSRWEEASTKALVPGEEGNYRIRTSAFPRFDHWRIDRRDVVVTGCMVYSLDNALFRTEFEGTLRYSEGLDESGNVKTRWRNRIVV